MAALLSDHEKSSSEKETGDKEERDPVYVCVCVRERERDKKLQRIYLFYICHKPKTWGTQWDSNSQRIVC